MTNRYSNINKKPVAAATPTLLFVSLQGLSCFNRPFEGNSRIWELLHFRDRIIASCGREIEYTPEQTTALLINAKSDKTNVFYGDHLHKMKSRLFQSPGLEKHDLNLSFTCLTLTSRQDRKYGWEEYSNKNLTRSGVTKGIFHLSLPLWKICLLERSKPKGPPTKLFVENLMYNFENRNMKIDDEKIETVTALELEKQRKSVEVSQQLTSIFKKASEDQSTFSPSEHWNFIQSHSPGRLDSTCGRLFNMVINY